jgi:phosphonopyruvate decarboxylase
LLKDICGYVTDNASAAHHIITANEGNAIGLAVGHYIATNRLACVYMQNSGFGNCVNPLLSISDPACYGVPMLLLVGWRGEPNTKDEPQHKKQGAVQEALLKAMDMPYAVLSNDIAEARTQIADAVRVARERRCAYTLLVRADTFAPYKMAKRATAPDRTFAVSREQVFDMILQKVSALSSSSSSSNRDR